MKRLIVGALKVLVFVGSFTLFGFGMFPEIGDRPHGAFALFFLSVAMVIAWVEVKGVMCGKN